MDTSQLNIIMIAVDEIIVEERARDELKDMEALKASIKRRGMLKPIIINDSKTLVDGERRLTAAKEIGLKEIPARLYSDLTELEKLELELEANLHQEFTWDEKAKLRAKIHALKQSIYGAAISHKETDGWGLKETAEHLDMSVATLSEDIALVEAAKTMPNILKFTSRRQALKFLDKVKETAILTELAKREGDVSGKSFIYQNADSVQYLKENVEDETIDLVIFDPPWGIDADTNISQRSFSLEKPLYDDSQAASRLLAKQLVPELYRVMKNNTHMYVFLGMELSPIVPSNYQSLEEAKEALGEKRCLNLINYGYDLGIYHFWIKLLSQYFELRMPPCVWIKESGGYTDFEVRLMPRYEAFLFCSKGLRRLSSPCSDVFEFNRPPSLHRIHPQQKPVGLLQQFIRLSTVKGEIVLDPTAGSGSSVVAALKTGRRVIGIEKDFTYYSKGIHWIQGIDFSGDVEEKDETTEEN